MSQVRNLLAWRRQSRNSNLRVHTNSDRLPVQEIVRETCRSAGSTPSANRHAM